MRAALRGSQDVALIFDRPRTQQQVPVGGAGCRGEGRGHEDEREVAEAAIELGEADVVAHRQAHATARQVQRHPLGPRFDRAPFIVAFVVMRECEQMDLVVARDASTIGTID
jgi:hypothetical protein